MGRGKRNAARWEADSQIRFPPGKRNATGPPVQPLRPTERPFPVNNGSVPPDHLCTVVAASIVEAANPRAGRESE